MAANWWEEDKPAAGAWWEADKPTRKAEPPEAASARLDAVRGAGMLPEEVTAGIVGAGRMADRLWEGAKQGGYVGGAVLAELLPERLRDLVQTRIRERQKAQEAEQAENTRLYKPLADEMPISTAIGEAAVLAAAPMGAVTKGAGALRAAGEMALSGAAPALVEFGTVEEKAKNATMAGAGTAAGSLVGRAVGAVASRAGKPVQGTVTQTQQAANQAAERLGLDLTAGEQTGSRALKWSESAIADMPFAAGREQARVLGNDKKLAAAALRSIGQQGDEILPATLAAARTQIGGEFQRILNPLKVRLDGAFVADVNAITGSKVMKELRDESVDALVDQFRNLPPGKVAVTGEWFQQNKTALDAAIRTAYNNGQAGKARALEAFEDALDGAARRSMGAKEADAYELARKQWANLRLLETGQVVKDGRVMPAALDQALKTRYKSAYREGGISGEMADIASLSSTLRAPPQSGTTPRAIYSGLAGGAAMADPLITGSMLASPAFLQFMMQSQPGKRYLTKGVYELGDEAIARLGTVGGLAGLGYASAQR